MASGEKANQKLMDHLFLSHDDFAQFLQDLIATGRQGFDGFSFALADGTLTSRTLSIAHFIFMLLHC